MSYSFTPSTVSCLQTRVYYLCRTVLPVAASAHICFLSEGCIQEQNCCAHSSYSSHNCLHPGKKSATPINYFSIQFPISANPLVWVQPCATEHIWNTISKYRMNPRDSIHNAVSHKSTSGTQLQLLRNNNSVSAFSLKSLIDVQEYK